MTCRCRHKIEACDGIHQVIQTRLLRAVHGARGQSATHQLPRRALGLPDASARSAATCGARWEGGTLVVETDKFVAPAELRGSNQHRNIEKRFTRVHADTIRYEFRVTNPTILVEINRNLECQAGEAASGGGSRWRSATVHHPPILGAAHVQ